MKLLLLMLTTSFVASYFHPLYFVHFHCYPTCCARVACSNQALQSLPGRRGRPSWPRVTIVKQLSLQLLRYCPLTRRLTALCAFEATLVSTIGYLLS